MERDASKIANRKIYLKIFFDFGLRILLARIILMRPKLLLCTGKRVPVRKQRQGRLGTAIRRTGCVA